MALQWHLRGNENSEEIHDIFFFYCSQFEPLHASVRERVCGVWGKASFTIMPKQKSLRTL